MYKFLRVRIREELYKKYKIKCIQLNISLPHQTEKIIKEFVKEDKIEIPFEVVEGLKK